MPHPVYNSHEVDLPGICQESVAVGEVTGINHVNILFFNLPIQFIGFLNDIHGFMFRFGEQNYEVYRDRAHGEGLR